MMTRDCVCLNNVLVRVRYTQTQTVCGRAATYGMGRGMCRGSTVTNTPRLVSAVTGEAPRLAAIVNEKSAQKDANTARWL